MHPILKAALILAGCGLCAATGLSQAQSTVSLSSGQSCTYSSYTFTPPGSFSFQCGGASSPGTLRLNTATPNDVNQGQTQTALSIERTGGSSGSISATVAITGSCVLASPSSPITLGDGVTAAVPLTITHPSTGPCTVTISGNVSAPSAASFSFVNPNAKGSIAFATPSQNATATQSNAVTINVTRSGAGAAATGGTVNYSCTASGLNPNTNTSGTLTFGVGNGTQPITINAPIPALLASPTPGTITCSLQQETVPGTTFDSISTGTHVVTVGPVTAPSCAPTASAAGIAAANDITVPSGASTAVTLAANCSPQGFGLVHSWTVAPVGAPNLSASNVASPTLTVPSNATPGAVFTYSVQGTNTGGGAGNTASVTVRVAQPTTTNPNCNIQDITWGRGTSVIGTPNFFMDPSKPGQMWAFRLKRDDHFGGTVKRISMDGIFSGLPFALSISKNPCEFQATKAIDFCQVAPHQGTVVATLASSGFIDPPEDQCVGNYFGAQRTMKDGPGQLYHLGAGETYYLNVRPYGANPSLPPSSVESQQYFKLWYLNP